MQSQRKQTKDQVAQLKQRMLPILNIPIIVTFGPHKFSTVIEDIVQARLADLINKPERREENGIFYTPTTVTFHCSNGKLHFILDDIDSIVQTLAGIMFHMRGGMDVCFICQ